VVHRRGALSPTAWDLSRTAAERSPIDGWNSESRRNMLPPPPPRQQDARDGQRQRAAQMTARPAPVIRIISPLRIKYSLDVS